MDAAEKKKIIEEYATHPGDTGSPDVQVAILTKRIAELTEHLKVHKGCLLYTSPSPRDS